MRRSGQRSDLLIACVDFHRMWDNAGYRTSVVLRW